MKYRDQLPQRNGMDMLTDGGLETVLIFEEGLELREFAAFTAYEHENGAEILDAYVVPYAEIAREHGKGLILESHTWRASRDWGEKLGYDASQLEEVIRRSVRDIERARNLHETEEAPIVISGAVGPRGDGYEVGIAMTADEAEEYHRVQVETLAETGIDMVSGLTLNYTDEAIGIVHAARRCGVPVVISFTVETDGSLPNGESLGDAIRKCDAETNGFAEYFMINCAHPTHFRETLLAGDADWIGRLGGIRANASKLSHAELDEAETLDRGDPGELANELKQLRDLFPHLSVFGGCCGTNHEHIRAIASLID